MSECLNGHWSIPTIALEMIVSLMLPYSLTFLILWTTLLLVWMAVGLPLGPDAPMFIEPLAVGG